MDKTTRMNAIPITATLHGNIVELDMNMVEYVCVRMVDQENIADHKKQTHFCGAHFPLRDLEYAERIGGQVRVDGQHKKDDQHRRGHALAHITGEREAEKQEHRAEGIYDLGPT